MTKNVTRVALWFDIVLVTLIILAFLLKFVYDFGGNNIYGTQDLSALNLSNTRGWGISFIDFDIRLFHFLSLLLGRRRAWHRRLQRPRLRC